MIQGRLNYNGAVLSRVSDPRRRLLLQTLMDDTDRALDDQLRKEALERQAAAKARSRGKTGRPTAKAAKG